MKSLAAVLLVLVLVSCGSPRRETKVIDTTKTLRELAADRGFYIGAAIAYSPLLSKPEYSTLASKQFNIVVPENVMKWDALEPSQGRFTFTPGDDIVKFAEQNKMKVRGHTLLWHQQLPKWLTTGKFTRDELLDILHAHIKGVVEHYKGRVSAWDVVNEAVADGGGLRQSIWLTTIGPDYIEQAFRFAHEADTDAKLFYNDYGGEGKGRKADAIYNLVKDLKDKGVPIDGVGLQMHIGISSSERPSMDDIAANMERIAALGLQVQITEMDVKIQNGTGSTDDKLAAQAEVYNDVLHTCLQQKAGTALLTWGFTDEYTWIPGYTGKPDAPLPFDKDYKPKPAYAALQTALSE